MRGLQGARRRGGSLSVVRSARGDEQGPRRFAAGPAFVPVRVCGEVSVQPLVSAKMYEHPM